jgi:archaemetzincin
MVRAGPALVAALLLPACGVPAAPPTIPPAPLPAPGADPDFPAKRPPAPGDWLAAFDEDGQTVEEYRFSCTNRKDGDRRLVVLQPIGGLAERHGDVLELVREYAGTFYGCEASVAPPIPLPGDAWDGRRLQANASRILVDLENRLPGKALAYLAFCEEDLFAESFNFVFGQASLRRRTGVWSLARYGGAGNPLFLRRVLQVATHEMGHILGLEHCVRYECLLNGSNSLRESDATPLHLCPECHEKARWNTGFDPAARYAALAAFYGREGLPGDAAFARRRAAKASAPRRP